MQIFRIIVWCSVVLVAIYTLAPRVGAVLFPFPPKAQMLSSIPTATDLPEYQILSTPTVSEGSNRSGVSFMATSKDGAMLDMYVIYWKSDKHPPFNFETNGVIPLVDDVAIPLRVSDFTLDVRRPTKHQFRSSRVIVAETGRVSIALSMDAAFLSSITSKNAVQGTLTDSDKQEMERILVLVAKKARKNGLIQKRIWAPVTQQ